MGIQDEFYGTLAWLFILNFNLPLQLFFFFHSSVCFADIWSMAYKPVEPDFHHIPHHHHYGGMHESHLPNGDLTNDAHTNGQLPSALKNRGMVNPGFLSEGERPMTTIAEGDNDVFLDTNERL